MGGVTEKLLGPSAFSPWMFRTRSLEVGANGRYF